MEAQTEKIKSETETDKMRKFLMDTARIVNSLTNRLRILELKVEALEEQRQAYEVSKTIRMRVNH